MSANYRIADSFKSGATLNISKKIKHYDAIVLGGGASGLFCALTAAKRHRRVLLIEKANKIGKKILMSGGGRCNFTNYFVEPHHFISSNPHFCKSALKSFTQWDFIAMVERYGIAYEERKHGQLFCLDSAKDILAMLVNECEQNNVDILTSCGDINVKKERHSHSTNEEIDTSHQDNTDRFTISYSRTGENHLVSCESLVIATGALSIPTLGGSGIGYDIATQFDLKLVERRAGLVPFMFTDQTKAMCERLSGTALEVEVQCGGQSFTENMLFTHRGLSGPSMLQISNYWQPGDELVINLLPGIEISDWLLQCKKEMPKQRLRSLLSKKLPKSLVAELEQRWWQETNEMPISEWSDKGLNQVAQQLMKWRLKPSGTEGYRTAEVTLGGVCTDGISSKTMEVKQVPGLYFIGEVLDVTGHLGGYNFQWAWSSGFAAGSHV